MDRMSARSEEIEDEADYVNAAVRTVRKTGTTSDQKFPSFTKSFPPLTVCWVTLLIIMALRIYFTSVMSENNTKLTVENQRLTTRNQELETPNKNLRTKNQNLTTQNEQLETRNKNLTTKNQELETQNQELERQKKDLTKKIRDIETNPNVSQAQWSIDAYCPRQNDRRQCEPCQKGWPHSESSCFAINNAEFARRKTWDEAREDCKGKISDLAVIDNQEEKTFISKNSWGSSGTNGYWIGLRVEDGRWKWVDGTDLTETSWIQQHPPTDGHCAISVQNEGWKSVNCAEKKMWICGKTALFV